MPDFYLDHYLIYREPLDTFQEDIMRIGTRGGGIIPGARQSQFLKGGGNSVNTAKVLSDLGVNCFLMLRTSGLGLKLLEHFAENRVDLSHVKTDGKLALTVALELEHRSRRFNVMMNDPGSIADFGPDSLTDDDLSLIRSAEFVCVLNWSSNLRGTELASKVFELVRKRGKGKDLLRLLRPNFKSERGGESN